MQQYDCLNGCVIYFVRVDKDLDIDVQKNLFVLEERRLKIVYLRYKCCYASINMLYKKRSFLLPLNICNDTSFI